MPRVARVDTPGLLQHVMIRGIERRKIFYDDKDREDLIDRLSAPLPETKTGCYVWAFLSHHAHFFLRSGPKGIAALMRRLLTGYAVSFNKRHRRHGQLFQNRDKSIICQEDAYLARAQKLIGILCGAFRDQGIIPKRQLIMPDKVHLVHLIVGDLNTL